MLIGLHGKAGSGKDTAFAFIHEWAGDRRLSARRDAFADRLKISAARALGHDGTPEECLEFCNHLKENGRWVLSGKKPLGQHRNSCITGRNFLQRYGTEAHREVFGYDFWVDACLPLDYDHSEEILIVTDVRFENEAQRVHDLGGEVWHILRTRNVEYDDTHISEKPLPAKMIDHLIHNASTLEHFRGLVLSRLEREVTLR